MKLLTGRVDEAGNVGVGKLDLVAEDVDEATETGSADDADLGLSEVGGEGAVAEGEEGEGGLEVLSGSRVSHFRL